MSTIIIHEDGEIERAEEKPVTKETVERELDRLQLQLEEIDFSVERFSDASSGVLFFKAVPPLKKR